MDGEATSGDKPLLDWAMRLCPDSPRKRVKDWITAGRFYLDGEVATQANLRLEDPGESLTLGVPDSSIASWAHRKKIHPKLTVLHLDESLAIVDKGFGLLSVPVEGHGGISALDVLGNYLNDPKGDTLRRRLFGSQAKVKPLPVHRLDQYTSGLLCLAMNPDARRVLIDQLRSHELLREYVAYADGRARSESGTWKHYLRLDRTGFRQSLFHGEVEGSTEAITHFSVSRIFERHRVTKLKIQLETGLKHQIRIQAAAEGLPLIGDRIYHSGTRKSLERKGATLPYGFKRQALHATIIGLKHPKSGRDMRFESQIPLDLARLEERLD